MRFRPHPECVDKVIRCPRCGRLLLATETGWACEDFNCGGIMSEQLMLAAVEAAIGAAVQRQRKSRKRNAAAAAKLLKRLQPAKLLRWLRRRSLWMQRRPDVGIEEATEAGVT